MCQDQQRKILPVHLKPDNKQCWKQFTTRAHPEEGNYFNKSEFIQMKTLYDESVTVTFDNLRQNAPNGMVAETCLLTEQHTSENIKKLVGELENK